MGIASILDFCLFTGKEKGKIGAAEGKKWKGSVTLLEPVGYDFLSREKVDVNSKKRFNLETL
jgi:hypothetical protein